MAKGINTNEVAVTECRICCRAVSTPHHRRDPLSGEVVEICVSTDHDGKIRNFDLEAVFLQRAARFDRKGITRSPGGAR